MDLMAALEALAPVAAALITLLDARWRARRPGDE